MIILDLLQEMRKCALRCSAPRWLWLLTEKSAASALALAPGTSVVAATVAGINGRGKSVIFSINSCISFKKIRGWWFWPIFAEIARRCKKKPIIQRGSADLGTHPHFFIRCPPSTSLWSLPRKIGAQQMPQGLGNFQKPRRKSFQRQPLPKRIWVCLKIVYPIFPMVNDHYPY